MTATRRRLLAGDALDVVVEMESARATTVVRTTARVAPSRAEAPGPLRALPVTALAYAPEVAVLVRLTLPFSSALDAGRLAEAVGRVHPAREALESLAAAVRIAHVDRAAGGLGWAEPDTERCGGLAHGPAFAAVRTAGRPLTEALAPVPVGALDPGLREAEATEEWEARRRHGDGGAAGRCVLMRGESVVVDLDAAGVLLGRVGPDGQIEPVMVVPLPVSAGRGAALQMRVPSAVDGLEVVPSVLASFLEGVSFTGTAGGERRIEALVVGAVRDPIAPAGPAPGDDLSGERPERAERSTNGTADARTPSRRAMARRSRRGSGESAVAGAATAGGPGTPIVADEADRAPVMCGCAPATGRCGGSSTDWPRRTRSGWTPASRCAPPPDGATPSEPAARPPSGTWRCRHAADDTRPERTMGATKETSTSRSWRWVCASPSTSATPTRWTRACDGSASGRLSSTSGAPARCGTGRNATGSRSL